MSDLPQADLSEIRLWLPILIFRSAAFQFQDFSAPPLGEVRFARIDFPDVSGFVGLFLGLAAVCFRLGNRLDAHCAFGTVLQADDLRLLVARTAVSLLVAILVIHVFPQVRGSGVNQTNSLLKFLNGYIPFRTAIGKFITAALAIGAGHSLGPEDPSLQIGSSLASALGRRMHAARNYVCLLSVGAAAGLAAAFNAPISAVLFVIEEVIGRWSAGILGLVVLGSCERCGCPLVSGITAVVSHSGDHTCPSIGTYCLCPARTRWWNCFGDLRQKHCLFSSAPQSPAALDAILSASSRWFDHRIDWLLWRSAGNGRGYEFMDQAMHDQFTWQMLATLRA